MDEEDYEIDELEILREIGDRLAAQQSLHEFVKQAWPQIEGGTPFVDGWHIQAVCEHLQAVTRRDIRNLLINVPPRTSKSSIVSVLWLPWVWINNPEERFIYASFAASLSHRDAVKCRRVLQSDWYQRRWGHIVQLSSDQSAKGRFENTRTGYRISTSVRGSSTGDGGSITVCDDPNNALEASSKTKRDATNDWWDQVWSTRLNQTSTGCRVVVQQRLHEDEVSGHVMSNDVNKDWVCLILPMEYEESRKCRTIILPSTKGKVWEDPRTKDGELLCPERVNAKDLAQLKIVLGSSYAISGQLQQRPSPEGGGIIRSSWFSHWKKAKPPETFHVIQSWDTALSSEDTAAYSACTTWGLFYDKDRIINLILLGLWRDRVDYPELRALAKRLYDDYRDDGNVEVKPDKKHVPDMVLVEAKATGRSVIQDFRRAGVMATAFDPSRYGSKIQRVRIATAIIESGRVWLPARPPDYKKLRTFAATLADLCALFPNSDACDVVDTMTQVLLRLISTQWLTHPGEGEQSSGRSGPKVAFYGA